MSACRDGNSRRDTCGRCVLIRRTIANFDPPSVGTARLVWVIFEEIGIKAQFPRQTPRRNALVEQIFGEKETEGILTRSKPREARKGQLELRQDLVATPPLFGGAADVVHDTRRDLPAADRRQQRHETLFVLRQRQQIFAAPIAPHAGEHCAVAEKQALLAECRHRVERPAPRVVIEKLA